MPLRGCCLSRELPTFLQESGSGTGIPLCCAGVTGEGRFIPKDESHWGSHTVVRLGRPEFSCCCQSWNKAAPCLSFPFPGSQSVGGGTPQLSPHSIRGAFSCSASVRVVPWAVPTPRLCPQQVGKNGHSSVEDARATMELYKVVEAEWEQHLMLNPKQE